MRFFTSMHHLAFIWALLSTQLFVGCLYPRLKARNLSSNSIGSGVICTAQCPSDYICVPHNTSLGTTSDFCVAKYEMKNNLGVATSESAGNPWVSISQTTALTTCQALGLQYSLISNQEWMTLATNIELVGNNWSNGISGDVTGTLNRGWNSNIPTGDAWNNTTVATSTGASCLYNSAADTCASTGLWKYKRTHTLSTGEEIWDLSGNVFEWIDWNVVPATKAYFSGDGAPLAVWREWSVIDTNISSSDPMKPEMWRSSFVPALGSNQGLGAYLAGTNVAGGAAMRGGEWSSGTGGGIFSLSISDTAASTWTDVGFRCVYRP